MYMVEDKLPVFLQLSRFKNNFYRASRLVWYRNRNRNLQTSKAPLKAKRRAPAYSRALRQIRGVI